MEDPGSYGIWFCRSYYTVYKLTVRMIVHSGSAVECDDVCSKYCADWLTQMTRQGHKHEVSGSNNEHGRHPYANVESSPV